VFARVDLWVHGHVHSSLDYSVGGRCRVVSNPRGYPVHRQPERFENANFDPRLVIDLGGRFSSAA
jgi:hypothetical protein